MTTRPTTLRLALGGLIAAIVGLGFGPFLLLWSRLPEPVASHFTTDGQPDGSSSRLVMLLLCGALIAVGAAMLLVLMFRQVPQGVGAYTGFVGGFLGALGGAIGAETAWSQRDLAVWTDARSGTLPLVSVFAVAIAGGAIAGRIGKALPFKPAPTIEPAGPVIALQPGEYAVWIGRTSNAAFQLLGVVLLGVSFVGLFVFSWMSALALFIGAAAVLSLSRLRVFADQNGLVVRYGSLPWPRTSIPLEDIENASPIDVRPMQWGGWGYRGSLRLAKQAAVVLRSGPGLRLDLTRNRTFVVTVDHPEEAAALLNGAKLPAT